MPSKEGVFISRPNAEMEDLMSNKNRTHASPALVPPADESMAAPVLAVSDSPPVIDHRTDVVDGSPAEPSAGTAMDPRLAELKAAHAEARDLIAIYRALRMTPALQAKAERLFAALDAFAQGS